MRDLFELFNYVKSGIKELRDFLELDEENSIIAFRGEAKDYGETKLLPSIYRAKMSIQDEFNFFEAINDYGITDDESHSYIKKAIDAQHYLQTSRLLDISFNLLMAIYFATSNKENDEHDANIYIFCFPKSFSPSSEYIENYYRNMLNVSFNNDEISKKDDYLILKNNFKVITHGYYNERMKLQSGGFILFPSENITPIPTCFYKNITIPSNLKSLIRKDLETYFSIFESSVYPEKEKRKEIVYKAMKNNRETLVEKDPILIELETFFEYLTYDIKSEIKLLKVKGSKLDLDKEKKRIYRKIRKNKIDIMQNIERIGLHPEKKEYYDRLVNFNFKGLVLFSEKQFRG